MKNIKSTLLIVGLVIVGIGSFFIYNQQQEKRFLEFEGYEVSLIEEKVDKLYNKDRTDLADNLTLDGINEVEQLILDVEDKKFSEKNQTRLNNVIDDYKLANELHTLQVEIDAIFEGNSNIVNADSEQKQIEELENKLSDYKKVTKYHNKNTRKLSNASEQLNNIKLAQEYLEGLFEDDELRDDVTTEEVKEAEELIDKIKSTELKQLLLTKLDGLNVPSIVDEEVEEEIEEVEEETVVGGEVDPEPEPESNSETVRDSDREQETDRTPAPPVRPTPPREPDPTPSSPPTRPNRPEPAPPEVEEREDEETAPPRNPVVTVSEESVVTTIPFETERRENSMLPQGEQHVLQQGKEGSGRDIYRATIYQNGTKKLDYIRSEVTSQPTKHIVEIGTRNNED